MLTYVMVVDVTGVDVESLSLHVLHSSHAKTLIIVYYHVQERIQALNTQNSTENYSKLHHNITECLPNGIF